MRFFKNVLFKALAALCLVVVLSVSGCTDDEKVIRETVIPDFLTVVNAQNECNALYESAIAAAETLLDEKTPEALELFQAAESETEKNIEKFSHPESEIGDEEEEIREIMKKHGISLVDYDAFFSQFEETISDYNDWYTFDTLIQNGDYEAAAQNLEAKKAVYKYWKEVFLCGIMELFAHCSDQEYIKNEIYSFEYITSEEVPWTNDVDKIEEMADGFYSECQEVLNRYTSAVNEKDDSVTS